MSLLLKYLFLRKRSYMTSMLLLAICGNLFVLAVPLHMLQVYDRVLSAKSIETLIYLTLIVFVALVVHGITEAVKSMYGSRLSSSYTVDNAEDVLTELVRDKAQKHDANKVLRDVQQVSNFLASKTFAALFDLPFAPIYLILISMLHYSLGILSVVGIVILSMIAWTNNYFTAKLNSDSGRARGEAVSFASAVKRRTEDIRAMGILPSIIVRWGQKMAQSLVISDVSTKRSSVFQSLSKEVRQMLQVLAMAWGAWLVIEGDMSGGMIFAANLLIGKVLQPIEMLIAGWAQMQETGSAFTSLQVVQADAFNRQDTVMLPAPKGVMEVQDLTYHPGMLAGHKPILKNVNFIANPGELIAIVGPSGGGKSTLARLMVGAIKAHSGSIKLDGFDLEQWSDAQRSQYVGYVPQDIVLMPGTVAENISRLAIAPDEALIVQAAKLAGIHDMIGNLSDGYSTMIGPQGSQLSGGQRQRVALARALYSLPRVLILDEPNSNLDTLGEKQLLDTLVTVREAGVLVLMVTQRRSILSVVNRILFVDGGSVREVDTSSPAQNNAGLNVAQHAVAHPSTSLKDLVKSKPEMALGHTL